MHFVIFFENRMPAITRGIIYVSQKKSPITEYDRTTEAAYPTGYITQASHDVCSHVFYGLVAP